MAICSAAATCLLCAWLGWFDTPPEEIVPLHVPIVVGDVKHSADWVTAHAPRDVLRDYYPDNPHDYFREESPAIAEIHQREFLWVSKPGIAQRDVMAGDGASGRAFDRITPLDAVDEPALIELRRGMPFDSEASQSVRIVVRARSTAPCAIVVSLSDDQASRFPEARLELEPAWRMFEADVRLPTRERALRPVLRLVREAAAIDIGDLRLERERLPLPSSRIAGAAWRYYVEYQHNNAGFRDDDFSLATDEATWRIAVLGDSYAYGQGVHADDTFCRRLEASLNVEKSPRGEVHIDVMNFAQSGTATVDQRRHFSAVVARYRPQVVLVTMCLNDNVPFAEDLEFGNDQAARVRIWSQRGYACCGRELALLAEECRAIGARLAVCVFANSADPLWGRLLSEVRQIVDPLGVPTMSSFDAFARGGAFDDPFVHPHDLHPNHRLHHAMAELLKDFLAAHGLLPVAK